MSSVFNAQNIAFLGFIVIAIILLGFAAMVLWKIYQNQISLLGLLAEPTESDKVGEPKASLARFQFLIFTFVVAGLFLLLSIEAGTFVEIPNNVLALIGLSSGSYLISKGVSTSKNPPATPPASPPAVTPTT